MKTLKIYDYRDGSAKEFKGSMKQFIKKLKLQERYDIMYTLCTQKWICKSGFYQFRAWTGPFLGFDSQHVDTGHSEKVFQVIANTPEEILEAVAPLIEHKAEWAPLSARTVRLWLGFHRR